MKSPSPAALAIAAHPDDIEFMMAGTLLLLRQAGWRIHYFNLCTGNLGSDRLPAKRIAAIRRREAQQAARLLGAQWHAPICDDLELVYSLPLLRRVAAVVREVAPSVVLTHSPQDYMEDHTMACRLAVTATFARGMPNFQTVPRRKPVQTEVTIYHAMPYMLRDPLGQPVEAEAWVDVTSVLGEKRTALAAHRSQKEWLDVSQGLDSYLKAMEAMAREVGRASGKFRFAEGWRRHLHAGFSSEPRDPLREALGRAYRLNPRYGSRRRG